MAQDIGGEARVPVWNIANVLTVSRVALVPVFAWLYLLDTTPARLAAVAVFGLAAVTDKVDGHLARTRGLVTDFGKIADPIADKALTLTAFALLSLDGVIPWWVTALIVVRELGVTVLRFVLVRRTVIAASSGGKIKTVLQIVAIVMLLMPWESLLPAALATVVLVAAYVVLAAAVAVTVITGGDYAVRAWRISRAARR